MGREGQSDARRFAAFISYSHADAQAAATLQRKLERYRLPRHIVRDAARRSTELGPIFRDREDLAAAPSLSAAIQEAIANAEALLVLCSPDAKASTWVEQEIRLFRSLHPDRPVLAVLLSGDPSSSFPPALTADGLEPLAADLREGGDGTQLAFLKIVAGIAGVPLDALIQRDAQRRLRRVTAVTLGAFAAMLIMGIMTAYAISARNEANRQRAEAEGLVEYMLTDLREKLKGVGRLDVMAAVNDRAMDHYARQGNLDALPADSLERRARLLHAMGEDEEKRGDLNAALAKFSEAHRTTEALLRQDPDNADRVFAHAQSEYYVGYIAWRQMDLSRTRPHWQAYLNLAERLQKIEPTAVRPLRELGYSHGNLCELGMREKRDITGSLKHCRLAIRYQEAALEREPGEAEIALALANRHAWLADALLDTGTLDEAGANRAAERQILDKLADGDPRNVDVKIRILWNDIGVAKILIAQKKYRDGIDKLRDTRARLDAIMPLAPGDDSLTELKIRITFLIARAGRDGGLNGWQQEQRRASALTEAALARDPHSAIKRYRKLLADLSGGK